MQGGKSYNFRGYINSELIYDQVDDDNACSIQFMCFSFK